MSMNVFNAGYVRINTAMGNLFDSLRKGNKDEVIRIANNLMEDTDDLIETVYSAAGVTEDDIVRIANAEDEDVLTKQAAWTPRGIEISVDIPSPMPQEASPAGPEAI